MKAKQSPLGIPSGTPMFQSTLQVLAATGAIVVVLDEQGQINMLNQAACRFTGYGPDEAMGRGWYEMIMPRERYPLGWQEFLRAGAGALQLDFECAILTSAGEERIAVWHASTLSQSDAFAGLLMLGTDVTPLRRTMVAARDDEAQLHHFIQYAPVAIAMFDREMRYLETSRKWLTDHDLEGRNLRGCFHHELFPQIEDSWKDMCRRCLAGEILSTKEEHFRRADGSVCWLRIEVRPWCDSGGNIGGIVVFSEDISARRDAEVSVDAQMEELRRWHQATLGREVRILELKREVNRLLLAAGKPLRYASAVDDERASSNVSPAKYEAVVTEIHDRSDAD